MKGPADLSRGWLAKAESDLAVVRIVLAGPGPYDTACFHCQQAVEKYMKGFLAHSQQVFPFTHDLRHLASACDALDPALRLSAPEVLALTAYAVTLRYDNEFWPTRQDGVDALGVAERVRSAILARIPLAP